MIAIFSLLETFILGTLGALLSFTSYQTIPKSPEVKAASVIAESSLAPETLTFGPFVEDDEPEASPTATVVPSPTVTPDPTATPTRIPTRTPMPTSTKKPTPTSKQSPSPRIIQELVIVPSPTSLFFPSPTPTLAPTTTQIRIPTIPHYSPLASTSGSLSSNRLFEMINDYRKSLKLPAFEKNEYLCKVADERRPELPNEIYGTGYIHQGLYDRKLPYWITENMAYYDTEDQIFSFWLRSSLHRHAIEGTYKYSCGACEGTICVELFTSFVSK